MQINLIHGGRLANFQWNCLLASMFGFTVEQSDLRLSFWEGQWAVPCFGSTTWPGRDLPADLCPLKKTAFEQRRGTALDRCGNEGYCRCPASVTPENLLSVRNTWEGLASQWLQLPQPFCYTKRTQSTLGGSPVFSENIGPEPDPCQQKSPLDGRYFCLVSRVRETALVGRRSARDSWSVRRS